MRSGRPASAAITGPGGAERASKWGPWSSPPAYAVSVDVRDRAGAQVWPMRKWTTLCPFRPNMTFYDSAGGAPTPGAAVAGVASVFAPKIVSTFIGSAVYNHSQR